MKGPRLVLNALNTSITDSTLNRSVQAAIGRSMSAFVGVRNTKAEIDSIHHGSM